MKKKRFDRRQRRRLTGATLLDLASKIGVSESHLSLLERGKKKATAEVERKWEVELLRLETS